MGEKITKSDFLTRQEVKILAKDKYLKLDRMITHKLSKFIKKASSSDLSDEAT